MTIEIELLPLPAETDGNAWVGYKLWDVGKMKDYARACVAHATAAKDAEIEATRAERDRAMGACQLTSGHLATAEARAERLAEALIAWHKQATDKGRRERGESPGHSHNVLGVWDDDNGKYAGVECAQCALWLEASRLRAALDQEVGNG